MNSPRAPRFKMWPRDSRRLQRIRASGLLVLPKTGHAVNLEEPEGFNRVLQDFFSAVEAHRWAERDPRAQATRSAVLPDEEADASR